MTVSIENHSTENNERWYSGITRYQWTVLIIASLGWVFDVFEGQIFVASMDEAMKTLVPEGTSKASTEKYTQIIMGMFLLGGALGGVLFGMLSDRIGRKRTMSLTIIMYSLFTCLSAFSQEWWHMAIFRFLVAMGVGGEWAVASSLVAEVFPKKARARVASIFHASSVFGAWLAIAAGSFLIGNESIHQWAEGIGHPTLPWRIGFGIGVFPALLIIWIRRSIKEPESWTQAQKKSSAQEKRTSASTEIDPPEAKQLGRISELFQGQLLRSTLTGVTLAAIGMATMWGAHIYGKNLLKRDVAREYLLDELQKQGKSAEAVELLTEDEKNALLKPFAASLKQWEMLGMFLVSTGAGIGLLCFGPLCEWLGRRYTFLFFHLGGFAISLLAFQYSHGVALQFIVLPIFGFLTLGMQAGYAVYFPELFPTRLRGTGTGFCFNIGRVLAAPILYFRGVLRETTDKGGFGLSPEDAASALSCLFLLGVIVLHFAPETKGTELPE